MKRISYGNEKDQLDHVFEKCCFPPCKTQKGQLHKIPCPAEECPQCGDSLLKCDCRALSPEEAQLFVWGIAASITGKEQILAMNAKRPIIHGSTYYDLGCLTWLMRSAELEVDAWLVEKDVVGAAVVEASSVSWPTIKLVRKAFSEIRQGLYEGVVRTEHILDVIAAS